MSRIQYFPISFFAMVMGLAGLTLAWEKANHTFALGISIVPALLAVLALLVFFVLAAAYGLKFSRYRDAVISEFKHPIKLNFFPAMSISLILLGTAFLQLTPGIAKLFWMIGAAVHLGFTLYVMSAWIHHEHFEIQHINPAWFIPVVGNVIVPIAGTELGYTEVSWFFFSIGIVFWVVLMTIIFYRVFFHNPMPARLMPTFFILLAPPAVGFVSYMKLVGDVDVFARILYYTGLYLTLLLSTQITRFARLEFFLSWWAYSFPLAAMTVATFVMAESIQSNFLSVVGVVLLVLLTVIVSYIFYRTVKAAKAGMICRPED